MSFKYRIRIFLLIIAIYNPLIHQICLAEFNPSKIMFAVNCGSDSKYVDSYGVEYLPDLIKAGIPYTSTKHINRVSPEDEYIYQTERYHSESLHYDIPIHKDGDYVLVLKFSEVYFKNPRQKMFDVALMGETVIHDLDIFDRAGYCLAHDEYIPFRIKHNKLILGDQGVQIDIDKSITLSLIKGEHDNPKINAFYVYNGDINDIPKLEPIPTLPQDTYKSPEDESYEEELETLEHLKNQQEGEQTMDQITQRRYEKLQAEAMEKERLRQLDLLKRSGDTDNLVDDGADKSASAYSESTTGPVKNPYDEDSSSLVLPIVFAIAAFIPILFLVCKI